MKTYNDYAKKAEELEANGLGEYIDMCVDAENVYPLKEGDAGYWDQMCVCLVDSVTTRYEEFNIKN